MSYKSLRNKRVYSALIAFTASLTGLVFGIFIYSEERIPWVSKNAARINTASQLASQVNAKFDPFKYLPSGSSIGDSDKHVVFADLDGDGRKEVTIFYTTHNGDQRRGNILILRPVGTDYSPLWEDSYNGSSGFADPSGVYDLNNNGRPQIVAYRTIGASCPGILDIYQWSDGAIDKITGDWKDKCQSELEINDLDGDKVREIIFRKLKYGVNRDIYHWNGKQYVRSNAQFGYHYDGELERLIQSIYSQTPLPASARVTWCEQASQIYILQQRYYEAIKICTAVLNIIDDPSRTPLDIFVKDGMVPEQIDRTRITYEVEKLQGKGAIYRLLGDLHKAAGNLNQARNDYTRARMFEAEAKQRESKLPH